jgi:23S rRNA pseudouridine1911/1915/1917 synthase
VIREEIPSALAGERLDRIVAILADLTRRDAAATIAAGAVAVDDEISSSGKVRLLEGQTVAIDPAGIPREELPAADPDVQFDVVHEDQFVVVVDKPPGLVVHPGAGNPRGTLVNGLLARYPDLEGVGDDVNRPGIVHRLDAGSSGLLVVARTDDAATHLIDQFATHRARRVYEAVVWGTPEARHGVIDAPIGRSRRDPLRMAIVADGRPSRTEYRVLESFDVPAALSRLHCRLETGRTHQIRVHLSSIDHPLVGDPIYGQGRPDLGLHRPFLHAIQLSFVHPGHDVEVSFSSPLAPDLRAWLDQPSD